MNCSIPPAAGLRCGASGQRGGGRPGRRRYGRRYGARLGGARRAFDAGDWSTDLDFRFHCLTQLHDALERNKERLRRILITEVGCPVSVSDSQIEGPIAEVKHWAEHARDFDYLEDTGLHDTPMGPARHTTVL